MLFSTILELALQMPRQQKVVVFEDATVGAAYKRPIPKALVYVANRAKWPTVRAVIKPLIPQLGDDFPRRAVWAVVENHTTPIRMGLIENRLQGSPKQFLAPVSRNPDLANAIAGMH
jgi:hypothetical protein